MEFASRKAFEGIRCLLLLLCFFLSGPDSSHVFWLRNVHVPLCLRGIPSLFTFLLSLLIVELNKRCGVQAWRAEAKNMFNYSTRYHAERTFYTTQETVEQHYHQHRKTQHHRRQLRIISAAPVVVPAEASGDHDKISTEYSRTSHP